jgi:multiple sugar transport system permease protein
MWSCVCLFPLVWIAVTSLKNGRQIDQGPFYLPFVDFVPNLDAWTFILTEPNDNLVRRYANSLASHWRRSSSHRSAAKQQRQHGRDGPD